MARRKAATLLVGLALAGSAAAAEMKDPRPGRSTVLPRPRDPNIAVQQELDAARRAGTRAAYDLFLERHPGHRLAKVAREEREALPRRPG